MFKSAKKYGITFIILIVCFIALLVLAASFPSSWIEKNVKKSSETLVKEGNKKIYFSLPHFQYLEFDNFSDALMINTAYSIDNKTPLYSIFTARKNYIPGITKTVIEDFVGDLASNSNKYSKLDQVHELYDTAHGEAPESYEYGRYWHGYMIFLRPLLIIFHYWQIRVFLTFILAVLAIYFLTLIEEKLGKIICIIFLVALYEIDYFYIGLSLLNSPVAILMMIFAIFLLKKYDTIKSYSYIFFVIGCLVGFFDLLDYPLVVYEIGILVYLLLKNKARNYEIKLKDDFTDIIKLGFFWFLGYALTWFTKWVLLDILYHKNMIEVGIKQVLYRTSGTVLGTYKVSSLASILLNILYVGVPLMINILVVFLIICIYPRQISLKRIKGTIPFMVVGLIPILWLGIFKNHSYQHVLFTYRILLITLIVFLMVPAIIMGFIFQKDDDFSKKA